MSMSRRAWPLVPVAVLALVTAACGGDAPPGSGDAAVPDLSQPDRAAPPDLLPPPDFKPPPDLVVVPDMTFLPDLVVVPDIVVVPDLVEVPDIVVVPDLIVLPDLTFLPDLLPTCSDNVKNGTETDVDCGGTCPNKCGPGKGCAALSDCAATYACLSNTCAAGQSCKTLQSAGVAQDGVYKLDPCGTGAGDYYCDMTRDGGGWTVAGWQAASAKTHLGIADRNKPGDTEWSRNLACVSYGEIMVFNRTYNESFKQTYTTAKWNATMTNMVIGPAGTAFKQGTYGPQNSLIMMACVDYSYGGGTGVAYGCDNDSEAKHKGHIADYAGEYCAGGRLDNTWAWTNGTTCKYRGQQYSWGFAIR